MLQNLFKLTSILVLGLLISCSSSDGDAPSTQIIVSADDADNGNSTASTNTGTGSVTGLDTGTQTGGAGDTTASTTGTDGTTGNATDTGANTTDAGTDATAGTGTGTATAGSTAGTDGTDTTTGVDTTGTTDDIGTTTDGTTTGGATTGSDTDAGNDTAGTAGGDTTGATTADGGATAGTDTGGTDTGTTTGGIDYPLGSLANRIETEGNLSEALAALQDARLDLSIDDPMNEWTLFLPTDEAIADLALSSDFDLQRHIVSGVVDSVTLAAFNGRMLTMNNGEAFIVDVGGTQDLTIAGATVIKADIEGNLSETVLHVIDTVIVKDTSTTSSYPAGSLADVLFQRGDMTNVLEALNDAGLIESINDTSKLWTLFLPHDNALDDPRDFDSQVHIFTLAANDSQFLTGISGLPLFMSSNDLFDIGGGGTDPLTIGGIEIIEEDVQNEDNEGSFVHIIDGLLVPEFILED